MNRFSERFVSRNRSGNIWIQTTSYSSQPELEHLTLKLILFKNIRSSLNSKRANYANMPDVPRKRSMVSQQEQPRRKQRQIASTIHIIARGIKSNQALLFGNHSSDLAFYHLHVAVPHECQFEPYMSASLIHNDRRYSSILLRAAKPSKNSVVATCPQNGQTASSNHGSSSHLGQHCFLCCPYPCHPRS